MAKVVVREQKRTNIYVVDEGLYVWAQYRAKLMGYKSVSEYLFDLVKQDKATTEKKDAHAKNKKEKSD